MHAPGYEDKPTAYVMPLVPMMFAALGPESLVRLRLAQLVIAGLTMVVVYQIGVGLFNQPIVGWLAVGMLWINLGWMIQPLYVLTEPLFLLLFLLALWVILYKLPDYRYGAGLGVLLGLAWLTRGALVGPLAVIVPYLWWRYGWRIMMLVGVAMGLTVLPWVIRNYYAFEAIVPGSTQSSNVLSGAYNDLVYENPWGDGWANPDLLYREEAQAQGIFDDEIRYGALQQEKAVTWIKANPQKIPKLWVAHTVGFIRPWLVIARNDVEFLYQFVHWGLMICLILYGSYWAIRHRHKELVFCLLVIGGGFLMGLAFFAIPRYRLPYIPLFALLEATALWQLWLKRPQHQAGIIPVGSESNG